jgi:hypothetical protein
MSAEIPGIRPRVISRELRDYLDEYRGLRHVVGNVYTVNLIPPRLHDLVTALRPCYTTLTNEVITFCEF